MYLIMELLSGEPLFLNAEEGCGLLRRKPGAQQGLWGL